MSGWHLCGKSAPLITWLSHDQVAGAQEVQQAADKLARDLQAKEDELEQLLKANNSLKVIDANLLFDTVPMGVKLQLHDNSTR